MKFGRNWVTKKEWLDEYLAKAEEYKNHVSNSYEEPVSKLVSSFAKFTKNRKSQKIYPPENLPVEINTHRLFLKPTPKIKFSFVFALVFILLIAELAFGKDSLKYGFETVDPYVASMSRSFSDIGGEIAGAIFGNQNQASANSGFSKYVQVFFQKYSALNNSIEDKISQVVAYFIKTPSQQQIPEEEAPLATVEESLLKDEITKLQSDVNSLAEIVKTTAAKETVKEVSSVTQIIPIKEITREVTKIEDASLIQIRANITDLQQGLRDRLYAPGGVITQQVYMTQPVSSPKFYQQDGDIVFQAAGMGNVILSAGNGVNISGSQVIIDSTDSQNPNVYITDGLVINSREDFGGNLLDVQSSSTSKFYIEHTGNAFLTGNLNISGSLVASSQTIQNMITVNATTTILAVTGTSTLGTVASGTWQAATITAAYGGTGFDSYTAGDILFATTTNELYKLPIGSENHVLTVIAGKPGWATSTGGVATNTSWTVSGNTMYATDTVDNVLIGTTATSSYMLDVNGTLRAVSTSIFSGSVGFGTASPEDAVHVIGNLRVDNDTDATNKGCLRYNGALNQLEYSNDCTAFSSFAASSGGGWTDDGTAIRLTTGSDYVGIGTSTPTTTLTVYGTSTFFGGNFGIGTTTPQETLSVVGNIYGSGNLVIAGTATASILDVSGTSTLGTVTSGIWQGTAIADNYVANDITLTNITQITNRAITDLTGTLSFASTTGTVEASRGGTGQDTSSWTGLLRAIGGTWSTTTDNSSNWDSVYATVNASSSNWDLAYGWGDHALAGYATTGTALSSFSGTLAISSTTGILGYTQGGTGTSTALQSQYLWWGDGTGGLVQVASSTFAGGGAVTSLNTLTGGLTLWGTSPLTVSASGTAGLVLAYTESDPVWTASSTNFANWNTAYDDRLKWDGGSTDLVAATGRTSLGLGDSAVLASSTWLKVANDLSDLNNTSTARTNLGLGSIATYPSTDYLATGTLGVSVQPYDVNNATTGTALSSFSGTLAISSTTGILGIVQGGTGTSTALEFQNLWWGDGAGNMVQVASSTFAGSGGVTSLNTLNGALTLWGTSTLTVTASGTEGLIFGYTESDPVWTASSTNFANWNTAYDDRLKWDGGSTDLVAATGRTSLGLGDSAVLASSTWLKVANDLSDLNNTSTARTNLGLAIGTDVQAYDANNATTGVVVASLNGNTGAQTLWGTDSILTVTASGTAGLVFNVPDNATTGTALSSFAGAVTDAQVPDTITIANNATTGVVVASLNGNTGAQTLWGTSNLLTVTASGTVGQVLSVGTDVATTGVTTLSSLTSIGTLTTLSVSGTTTLATAGGRVGIGTSTPAYLFDVYSAGGSVIRLGASSTDAVTIGNDNGKLTVGTVDPVFNIFGDKYATYMSGMTGVKEETTGVIQLVGGEYIIDFKNLEEGSDLWIFYRVTDFGENWGKLTVLLSSDGSDGVWYRKDPTNRQLVIYSDTASSVSYRLTAPRFDWQKWLNVAGSGVVGGLEVDGIINDQYAQSTSTDGQEGSQVEDGLLGEFVQRIKNALASLGLSIENGIASLKEIVTETLTAKKARLDKIEMVDQTTGDIYCTWVENGEWQKIKGECDNTVSPQGSSSESPVITTTPVGPVTPTEVPAEESSVPEETSPPAEEAQTPEIPTTQEVPAVEESQPSVEEPVIEEAPAEIQTEPAATPVVTESPAPAGSETPAEAPSGE
ncbi:MAG: hypothetical protein WC514_00165 [Candidatus Paceibacterota bacterium]